MNEELYALRGARIQYSAARQNLAISEHFFETERTNTAQGHVIRDSHVLAEAERDYALAVWNYEIKHGLIGKDED